MSVIGIRISISIISIISIVSIINIISIISIISIIRIISIISISTNVNTVISITSSRAGSCPGLVERGHGKNPTVGGGGINLTASI